MKRIAALLIAICLSGLIVSCQTEQDVEFARYYSAGAALYQKSCQNCHGEKGEGLAAMIPPLNDATFLKDHNNQLPCYLQKGLKGQLMVNGKTFDGAMPAASLSPIEMAQVLTYVSNSFGNKLGLIDNEAVTKQLNDCK